MYRKCNIKFDDERCDLVLDFCTSQQAKRRRLLPDQAKEMNKEGQAEAMSASDMTELLDAEEGELLVDADEDDG